MIINEELANKFIAESNSFLGINKNITEFIEETIPLIPEASIEYYGKTDKIRVANYIVIINFDNEKLKQNYEFFCNRHDNLEGKL